MRSVVWVLLVLMLEAGLPLAVSAEEAHAEEVASPPGDVTLEFQAVNILDVLKLLSKRSGLNIVAGKNVQGQVSIFLQNVQVMDALATILETSDLAYIKDRGIIKVMTKKDYEALYGKPYEDTRMTRQYSLHFVQAEALSQTISQMKSAFGKVLVEPRTNTLIITETPEILSEIEELIKNTDQPSISRVFKLKYAKVEDLEPKLLKLIQEGQGSLETDKKSNRVFVRDTEVRVERVRKLIEAFDVRQHQVLIVAKVMEVKLSDAFRFGIDWQLVVDQIGSLNTLKTAATYTVAPPAGATLTALTMGSGLDDLQTVIQMIEIMGKTNTLSSPRLTVLNNEEAKLAVATKEPFVSQTVVQSVNSSSVCGCRSDTARDAGYIGG